MSFVNSAPIKLLRTNSSRLYPIANENDTATPQIAARLAVVALPAPNFDREEFQFFNL